MREQIQKTCKEIQDILIAKNESYGNAVLDPIKIFSKLDVIERIKVRLDDKLSRIARGHDFDEEDTELDLIGYLILKRVKRNIENENEKLNSQSTEKN